VNGIDNDDGQCLSYCKESRARYLLLPALPSVTFGLIAQEQEVKCSRFKLGGYIPRGRELPVTLRSKGEDEGRTDYNVYKVRFPVEPCCVTTLGKLFTPLLSRKPRLQFGRPIPV